MAVWNRKDPENAGFLAANIASDKDLTEEDAVSDNNAEGNYISSGIGKKSHHIVSTILCIILCSFGVLLLLSYRWAVRHFANLEMDEIIYQLSSPLEGTGDGLIGNYINKCLIVTLIFTAALIFAAVLLRKKSWYKYFTISGMLAGSILIISTVFTFSNLVNLRTYISDRNVETDFYEKNYIDPATVKMTFPEKKRNLIYIYMESMETSFADYENGGASKDNYIPELVSLANENTDFSGNEKGIAGAYAFPGSTWTMAGIVSTTAGLPLITALDDNEMENQSVFFPNLTTMGDILEDAGYRQVFECGSDATFGGRRTWFKDHGNYEFLDTVEAREEGLIPEDYDVFWGYEDEKLFDFAEQKITELSKSDEPFNYTILTVDTHAPDGYICEDCKDKYGSDYENAIACSSKRVYDFVRWVQKQDFYENTTIVITGDHPSMSPDIKKKLDSDYIRRTYTCYINPAVSPKSPDAVRHYSTYDDFPTTLAALGVEISGNRLGLGTNLFSNTETLTEHYGFEDEKAEISHKSDYLAGLETIDADSEKIVDDYSDFVCDTNVIDDSHFSFSFPALTVDADKISSVKARVWYYDSDDSYVHWWFDGIMNDDGSWTIENDGWDCAGAGEVNYQILAVTAKGAVNLGSEQVLELSNAK